MSPTARRVLLIIAGTLLTVCLCGVFVAGALFAGWVPRWAVFNPPGTEIGPAIFAVTEEPPDGPPTTGSDPQREAPGSVGLPSEVRAEMDEIQEQISALRGLRPRGSTERALLSPDELRQRVLDDFLADYSQEEADDDVRTLAMLDLLERDFDLWDLYLELYSEQIAGYYDDEFEVMYVVQGETFGGPERLTYAHEYVHALQDQVYDLDGGLEYNDETCEANYDRCTGIQALVEGDATLAEEQWLRTYATRRDIESIIEFVDSFQTPVFDSAPPYLQDSFIFPYEAGLEFVRSLFREGGWAAVDAAYLEPPQSSEQILHPDRYPEDKPVELSVPDLLPALGSGWREIDNNTLGELFTRYVLAEHLPAGQARDAAAGWGGDIYLAFYDDRSQEGALVVVTAWDTIRDTQDFMLAFRDYGDARFGERTESTSFEYRWETGTVYVIFERMSDQTLWILAPDKDTAAALRAALTFPAPSS